MAGTETPADQGGLQASIKCNKTSQPSYEVASTIKTEDPGHFDGDEDEFQGSYVINVKLGKPHQPVTAKNDLKCTVWEIKDNFMSKLKRKEDMQDGGKQFWDETKEQYFLSLSAKKAFKVEGGGNKGLTRMPAELVLRLIDYLDGESAVAFLWSSLSIQNVVAQDKKVCAKIAKKLSSQSKAWKKFHKLFSVVRNNIKNGSGERTSSILAPQGLIDLQKESYPPYGIRVQRWWANQYFLLFSLKTIDLSSKLILADLQTTELTFEHNLDLAATSFLWKNFIIQFKKNDVMHVTKIQRVDVLETDVPKTIGQNNLPFQFDLCGDNIVCWNRVKIVLIDLKNLENYWGNGAIPFQTIETGIFENNYSRCTVVSGENLQETTNNVKTILYKIATLRQIENNTGEFSRKVERKLVAINIDTSKSQPKIAQVSWDGKLFNGETEYAVCNSGDVQQFAFFERHNYSYNLGIRLKGEDLKIYKVDLKNFNLEKCKVHFGNVIIIQDVCPAIFYASTSRVSNILCFNLCGQLVWELDSGRLGHSRLDLLPTIMIDNRLLLLHGKAKQETVFVMVETGAVASKIPDLHNSGQNILGTVFWLGHRQLNVNDIRQNYQSGHLAELISFV